MLNDAAGFKSIFIAAGYTDLRRGIDGLAGIVQYQFELDPHDKETIFLFCGRKNDRIKALLWEGDGFLLMYKRVEEGSFKVNALIKSFKKANRACIVHLGANHSVLLD